MIRVQVRFPARNICVLMVLKYGDDALLGSDVKLGSSLGSTPNQNLKILSSLKKRICNYWNMQIAQTLRSAALFAASGHWYQALAFSKREDFIIEMKMSMKMKKNKINEK